MPNELSMTYDTCATALLLLSSMSGSPLLWRRSCCSSLLSMRQSKVQSPTPSQPSRYSSFRENGLQFMLMILSTSFEKFGQYFRLITYSWFAILMKFMKCSLTIGDWKSMLLLLIFKLLKRYGCLRQNRIFVESWWFWNLSWKVRYSKILTKTWSGRSRTFPHMFLKWYIIFWNLTFSSIFLQLAKKLSIFLTLACSRMNVSSISKNLMIS